MKVLQGLDTSLTDTPAGVALGNFDGLHIGHMALVNTMLNESRLKEYRSVVYTFYKHPAHILRKKLVAPLIMTIQQKINILEKTGVEYLCLDEFDESFSRLSPEEFVKQILVDKLKIRLAVVGFNYVFGYKGKGSPELLKEMGKKYGFNVIVVPPVKIDDKIISSTLIRKYIQRGDMEKVFQFLGRHFSILGRVGTGKKLGGKMGFPTANILPEPYMIIPSPGVYVTRTSIGGQWFNSITNVGYCPTIQAMDNPIVETHILDFDDDVYNQELEIYFLSRLRGEKKFESYDDLIRQVKSDIERARKYIGINDL